MKVGIIGSGNVGEALAAAAKKAGHAVTISSHHTENAQEAVKHADLVILAVPTDKVDEVVGALTPDLDGKVIIDVSNHVDMNDPGKTLDGTAMAEIIRSAKPRSPRIR